MTKQSSPRLEHLVLLHGWGNDSRCWQPLLKCLNTSLPVTAIDLPGFGTNANLSWPDDEKLLQQLEQQLPHNCLLIGWSLGGMLAVKLAARAAHKITALVTIATNSRFIGSTASPGMAAATFCRFSRAFNTDAGAAWQQFCGLQAHGDKAMRKLLKQLKQWQPIAITPAWTQALEALARWDNRALLATSTLPSLHVFGQRDALIPIAATEQLRELGATVEIVDEAGHAPHISFPERVAQAITGIVSSITASTESGKQVTAFDKAAVARSFGRAAASYDGAAHLQRAVCRQLLREAENHWQPRRILDLGSGTGYGSQLLQRAFPAAQIIALDIAAEMLAFARNKRPVANGYIAADAEQLPLASGSIDLVFSSLALQWCYQLPQLFREIRRVMATNGRALIATLGPGTLRELEQSWAQVDNAVHVNRFLPADNWQSAARANGFNVAMLGEQRVMHCANTLNLMRDLKNIGAHNINHAAAKGLSSRNKLQQLKAAYESLRTAAGLPATYQVIYLNLSKDEAKGSIAAQ
ncbi:MAG: malonyl-ACP O-methyltransferase BioC [Gammaproteobacteria bacterium]|nr:malonyl-ACP O-methyltransferase BioC [Gammaproteobacteria bacterium]